MEQQRIIDKVRKLLRLSSSSNHHEAALAAERVQMMLSEYNLTLDDITEERASARVLRTRTRKQLEGWAHYLARGTAQAFDCDYYHSITKGETAFVGIGADPEVCSWTYSYLYNTLMRLASAHIHNLQLRTAPQREQRQARKSFLFGASYTIIERLEAQKEKTPVTPGALVPVKGNLIDAAMPKDVRHSSARPLHLRAGDCLAGICAGQSVPLSTPINV